MANCGTCVYAGKCPPVEDCQHHKKATRHKNWLIDLKTQGVNSEWKRPALARKQRF